jgi:hypothetical protein
MHSHDRTLIARLGFSDPDKKNDQHDLACQYLALPENCLRLAKLLEEANAPVRVEEHVAQKGAQTGYWERRPGRYTRTRNVESCQARLEVPIQKGQGQYATTIGFLDVAIYSKVREIRDGEVYADVAVPQPPPSTPRVWQPTTYEEKWQPFRDEFVHDKAAYVEVKIAPAKLGETLRQIGLYRQYVHVAGLTGHGKWVLATAYPLPAPDLETLRAEGVHHIQLGEKFLEYVTARQTATPETPTSPEF